MIPILIYHYFLAHGVQYGIHYFVHHRKCPSVFSHEHRLHHISPKKITWYGNPTNETDFVGIYFIAYIVYVMHIFLFYKRYYAHLISFTILATSFSTFHGMCHIVSKEEQQKIPVLKILFEHHHRHHSNTSKNFGFGDLFYDYIFGTLDLGVGDISPIPPVPH